jgi:hypothetical protein
VYIARSAHHCCLLLLLLLLLLLQEDEDDDLQRAIKASLLTAAQEGHPTDTAQLGSSRPDLEGGSDSWQDKVKAALAAGAGAAAEPDLDMPQWMNQGGVSGAAVDCSTPPSTPKSQACASAPLPALLQPHRQDLDDNLHSWVPVGDAEQQQQQQQQRAGSGGLSGGAAGLFDGLAFSDERPAAPRSQQQQQGDRCMPAGTPFAGLPRLGALAPSSPARIEQPQPARGCNVSNSSGAGGPFSSHRNAATAAAGGGGAAAGFTVVSWLDGNDGIGAAGSTAVSLLDGIDGMTEEQQLKRAMELSLMESAAAAGGGGGSSAAATGLAGLVDKDGYDEEAALQKALEESAAAAEMQQLQQQVQDAEAAKQQQQQGGGEAADAAQLQQAVGSDAAAGSGDAEGGVDDDAVVVAESGAGGDGGQQQQQRQRLPLVSSCEALHSALQGLCAGWFQAVQQQACDMSCCSVCAVLRSMRLHNAHAVLLSPLLGVDPGHRLFIVDPGRRGCCCS